MKSSDFNLDSFFAVKVKKMTFYIKYYGIKRFGLFLENLNDFMKNLI